MPKQIYTLGVNPPQNLEIISSMFWKNTTVLLDGRELTTIPGQRELAAGQDIRLPDGSNLHIQLKNNFLTTELTVLQDGKPLPGSSTDPLTRVKTAYGIIYFLGGLNLILGALAIFFRIGILVRAGLGITSMVYGLVFLGLAYLTQRRVKLALILAMVVFALDGLGGYILALMQGYNPGITGLFIRILLLIPMYQGLPALRSLDREGGSGGL